MDRLEAMASFVAVVDQGGFSAAARKLGTPLATVSRHVTELEARLTTRLLQRSTRRVALTESGRPYYEACRSILAEVGEAERAAAGEYLTPRGELLITAPIVFGRLHLLPVLTDFLGTFPEIEARLFLADRVVHLLEEQIDIALRIGRLPDSSLTATRLGAIRDVVVGSPEHLARAGTPQRPEDLAQHACITFEGLHAPRQWIFRGPAGEQTVPVRSRLTVNTSEAAIDAAIAGLGLTRVLCYQAEAAIAAGRLRTVLQAFEPPPHPVSLVYPGGGRLPLKLRAFLDFAVPRLRARTPQG